MKRLVITLFLSLLLFDVYGNDCNCDFTLTKDEWKYDGVEMGVFPGSIICIEAGNRRQLHLSNFRGSPDKPLTFINCGGKVTIGGKGTYGWKTRSCKFFRITGTGSKDHEYGIEIKERNQGMQLEYGSSDFEIDHVEIHHIGFAGIMAKTDPTCDPATWRENFLMENVSIHHNYIHHTDRGEALYIGNSFYEEGRTLECGDKFPHAIHNLKVYKNRVHDTGSDGIQVGCAIKGCEIYDNLVERTGVNPFMNYQSNGIQVGEGTGGLCYNNIVLNPGANGIVVLGTGENTIFNNLIVNPGTNGFFCDERYTPGNGFNFFHNTIINPKQDGFRIYAQEVKQNQIINNIVVNPGAYDSYNADKTWRTGENSAYVHQIIPKMNNMKVSNNIFTRNINDVKFVNNKDNFRLTSASPAVNSGKNLKNYDITFDLDFLKRSDNKYDIGAYEFDGAANIPPVVDAGPDTTVWSSSQTFYLYGIVTDIDGEITSTQWEQVSGPNLATLDDTDKKTLKVSGFIEGEYIFNLTAIDDSKAISTDQVKVTVVKVTLPVIDLGPDSTFINPVPEIKIYPKEISSVSEIIEYSWELISGPKNTGWVSEQDTLIISQPEDGIYEFVLRVINSENAASSDTVKIYIYPQKPEISLTGLEIFCQNDTTLILNAPDGDYQYFWSDGSQDQQIEVLSSGKYYLYIENAYGLKSVTSDTLNVLVKEKPDKPIISLTEENVICSNDTIILNAPSGFDQYYWSNDSTGPALAVTNPGTFSVIVEKDGCKSVASDPVEILDELISDIPVISFEGELELCENENKSLKGPEGYKFYLWNTGDTTASIVVDTSGHYTLQVANCGESWSNFSDSVFVEFKPLPEKPLIVNEGSLAVCEGDSVKLSAPGGFVSYDWEVIKATENDLIVKNSGFYRVSVQSADLCWSDYSDSVEVVVTEIPDQPLLTAEDGISEICPNDSVMISGPVGFQEYIWNSSTTTDNIFYLKEAGKLSLIIGNNGCYSIPSDSLEIKNIDTNRKPVISFTGSSDLCVGESIDLTASTGFAYYWSNGDTTQAISVDTTGSYVLQVAYCPGILSQSSDTLILTFHEIPEKPTVSISGDLAFCDGDSVILEVANGFAEYDWTNPVHMTPQISVKESGELRVRVKSEYNCWSEYSDEVNVTNIPVPAPPVVDIVGNLQICNSDSVGLIVSNNFDIYDWSNGETSASIYAKDAKSYDVRVNKDGCWSDRSAPVKVDHFQIPNKPTIEYAGGSNYCINEKTELEAPEGYKYYKWNNNMMSRIIEVNQTDNYYVQVANCPEEWSEPSDNIDLIFHDLPEKPTIEVNGKLNFCEGENVELSAPADYVSYQWKGIITESRSITINETGTFQVRVRSEYDCWSTYSNPVIVTQIELPEQPEVKINGKSIICDDQTTLLSAPSGYDGYLWSNGAVHQNISVNENGTFSVKVNRGGCWSYFSESKNIRHNPIPEKPQIAYSGKTDLCVEETAEITAPSGYPYYLWSNGSTSNKVTVSNNSTYQLQVAYCENRWSAKSDPLRFNYHPVATPVIDLVGNTEFCEGESVQLIGPDGFKKYQWNNQQPVDDQGLEIKTSGLFRLRVSNSFDCWSTYSSEIKLEMIKKTIKPEIINRSNLSFCEGSSVTLESKNNYDEYLWSDGRKVKAINVTESGPYSLQVRNAGFCYSDASDPLQVKSLEVPDKPILNIPEKNSICEGESVEVSTIDSYSGYFWSNGANSNKINVGNSGSYAVRVKNQFNCWSQFSDKFDLNVIKTPSKPMIAIEDGNNEICLGDFVNISVKNEYSLYRWSTGSGNSELQVEESGLYSVEVSNCAGAWSEASDAVEIVVHDLPEVPVVIIENDKLVTETINQFEYQWYLNSSPILNARNHFYLPVFEGLYQVELITPNGCSVLSEPFQYDSDDKEVIIYPNPTDSRFRIVLVDPTISSGKVSIINAENRIIIEKEFNEIENYYIPDLFDLSNYNKGVYIIKIETTNNVINKKLVLK